jgi:hypothetical protein
VLCEIKLRNFLNEQNPSSKEEEEKEQKER